MSHALSHLTTEEMLDDLAASRMDMRTLQRLGATSGKWASRFVAHGRIIELIKPELERRSVPIPASKWDDVP